LVANTKAQGMPRLPSKIADFSADTWHRFFLQFLKLDLDVNLGLLEAKPVLLGSSLILGFGFLLPCADPP
jgi:hypothetical protein